MTTAKVCGHILLGKLKGNRHALALLFGVQNATTHMEANLAIPLDYKPIYPLTQ